MRTLLTELIDDDAGRTPDAPALLHRDRMFSYRALAEGMVASAQGFYHAGLRSEERVALFLPKQPETVVAMLGASMAGGVFVPVNPVLKAAQVGHILRDCNVRVLVTQTSRLATLQAELAKCPDLRTVVVVDDEELPEEPKATIDVLRWNELTGVGSRTDLPRRIDTDMAAILYTSGSTGRPKGVVLTHRNLLAGAESVAGYLENRSDDRLLAVLPLSFDYGLSQLTTAFYAGASVALMDYLLPQDVLRAVERHGVTGLAGVPPLWNQLALLEWPNAARRTLRYITNSGGAMPQSTLRTLRTALPDTRVYLMYGLTEAFRSTYLPPEQIDRRPGSMGKAIPNADIRVVRPDGTECAPGETGELVHRGALVARGYWNDPERTAQRFRPAPGQPPELPHPEIAVWSGDQVRRDEDGFLYFVGRADEMIKSSGYRISPTEIEEVLYASGMVVDAVALGLPHSTLGHGIVAVVRPAAAEFDSAALTDHCKRELPGFMVPLRIDALEEMPRNPNGKIDRQQLRAMYEDRLVDTADEEEPRGQPEGCPDTR